MYLCDRRWFFFYKKGLNFTYFNYFLTHLFSRRGVEGAEGAGGAGRGQSRRGGDDVIIKFPPFSGKLDGRNPNSVHLVGMVGAFLKSLAYAVRYKHTEKGANKIVD